MRALFVNENIGGHETVHVHLERALAARDDIEADFFHVGPRGPLRRVVGASIPGLGRLDLDFQPLRAQLASSGTVRKALRTRYADYDVLHVYTQNAALLSTRILREMPSVVSIDSTNDLNAYRMPHRHATRWTPKVLPVSRAVERRVFEAATLVVPNSDYVARSLRTTYGVTDERVRIVPMGVEVPSDLPPRDRDDGMPSIVFVGRQLEAKGGQRLLALHRERWSRRSTLDLVTTDPVEAHDGVRVHDDIVPGDGRLDAILRRGAVFVFPSEIDQSPNAVLEAMAMALAGLAAYNIAEPIQGVGGFVTPPKEYFEIAVAIIRKYGGIFICDEVQTGFGRTGGHWFGIEHWGVEPDIMTSAKGMGNGVPIGWTIATPEVADAFPGLTFSTFGGNPVSAAVGLAVIKVIEEDDLRTKARVVGDYFHGRLRELQEKYACIGDVRGMGLMQGIELVKDRQTKEPNPEAVLRVFEETKRRGVLIGKGGLYGNVIRTGLMLNTTTDTVDRLVETLDAGLTMC